MFSETRPRCAHLESEDTQPLPPRWGGRGRSPLPSPFHPLFTKASGKLEAPEAWTTQTGGRGAGGCNEERALSAALTCRAGREEKGVDPKAAGASQQFTWFILSHCYGKSVERDTQDIRMWVPFASGGLALR